MKPVIGLSKALLRKLSISQKMMLMGALLLAPLLMQTYLFSEHSRQAIDLARNEQLGIEYSVALRQLLEHLPAYRGANYALSEGDTRFSRVAQQHFLAIEKTIDDIDQVNGRIGKQLQVAEYWAALKAQWQILSDQAQATPAAKQFEKLSLLLNDLVNAMTVVGDTSGLVLDPNLESYYLIVLLVHELPELLNTTQTLRGLSAGQTEGLTESLHIPTMLGVLGDRQARLIKIQAKVLQKNPQLRQAMSKPMGDAQRYLSEFAALSIESKKDRDNVLDKKQRFMLASKAEQALFELYDLSAIELNLLLEKHIQQISSRRNLSIGLIFVCVLITLYLCAGFYFSMVRDLTELVKATKRIGVGDADYRIDVTGKDELSTVAQGFNDMATALGRSQKEVGEAYQQMENLTRLDPLSGLPNRRSLDDVLGKEWRRAVRNDSSLSVLMLDIDHFKQFNDFYGHTMGDDCIRKVAKELAGTLKRGSDFVARYGGEEFIVILPETNSRQASELAITLQRGIEHLLIPHQQSVTSEYVTVSIGVASVRPKKSNTTSKQLIECADRALYKAKAGGRNRCVLSISASEPLSEALVTH